MPNYPQPPHQWLAQQLSGLKADVQALKAQSTEYIVDAEGVCRAIVGNLAADQSGASTGLSGWGIAILSAGEWLSADSGATVARAYRSAAFSTTTTLGLIPLTTSQFDPGGNFNLGTGVYVTPCAGYYQVAGGVAWTAVSTATTLIASIGHNGGEYGRPSRIVEQTVGSEVNLPVADVIQCATGDTIELWGYSGATLALQTALGSVGNFLSVVRVA